MDMAANGESEEYPGIEAETSFEVQLYIYDLSKGLEKSLSQHLKGKTLPGIWHTGLVAYGREYFFGTGGVESCRPGGTVLGEPDQILTLGKTELPYSVFLEYIFALGEAAYRPGTFSLYEHNCNTFTQEVAVFLTGKAIPGEIRDLPQDILETPCCEILKEYFEKLTLRAEGSKGLSFGQLSLGRRRSSNSTSGTREETLTNGQVAAAASNMSEADQKNNNMAADAKGAESAVNGVLPAENANGPKKPAQVNDSAPPVGSDSVPNAAPDKDTKSEIAAKDSAAENPDKEAQQSAAPPADASPAPAPTEQRGSDAPNEADETGSASEPTGTRTKMATQSGEGDTEDAAEDTGTSFVSRRSKRYRDPPIVFQDVDGVGALKKIIEMLQANLNAEEKQALGELHEYLVSDGGAWALGTPHLDIVGRLLNDRNFPNEVPILTMKVLQSAVLKEDVILLLHQDRKDHHVMSYLYRIEHLLPEEQEEITTLMCNMCYHTSTFDWLMYISEWQEEGHACNNSKVTVRVAVHSLLGDGHVMQERGAALMYNLALKELFDDTATELATAVLQFLHGDLKEETAFHCLTALLRFLYISFNDVPALARMLGPDLRKFLGKSERVDQLVEQIHLKLTASCPLSADHNL